MVHLILDVMAFGNPCALALANSMVDKFAVSNTWFGYQRCIRTVKRSVIFTREAIWMEAFRGLTYC